MIKIKQEETRKIRKNYEGTFSWRKENIRGTLNIILDIVIALCHIETTIKTTEINLEDTPFLVLLSLSLFKRFVYKNFY